MVLFCMIFGILPHLLTQPVAFPGAEGFGKYTSGGRGGKAIEVTNLDDSGPGSLREACLTPGPRTIVFRVSGTIELQSELNIDQDSLTIAGQTAPGDGICIKNYQVTIRADNVILRFMRFRPGDEKKQQADALSAYFQKNIIIDHCSFSWGNDEVLTVRDNERTTVQWCMISESFNHSSHRKGNHGYGGIWGGKGATFHHNLLAHHTSRTPRFNGSRYHGKPGEELVDFRNNVIYNWGFNSSYGGEAGSQNIVANYFKAGPGTRADSIRFRIVEPWDDKGQWFVDENFVSGHPQISQDNWLGGVQGKYSGCGRVNQPFPVEGITEESAEAAFERVLACAGAVYPKRDMVDARIVLETADGTAAFGGVWGEKSGIIDSQTEAGGWPLLRTYNIPSDTDHDGMPDTWEKENRLNPHDPADQNLITPEGYTQLENYLNSLVCSE
jgi:pectate lyase